MTDPNDIVRAIEAGTRVVWLLAVVLANCTVFLCIALFKIQDAVRKAGRP